jgi:hypothetical protein
MSEAINEAIPSLIPNSSTYPHWFSSSLKHYINKKSNFLKKYKKSNSDYYYSMFSYYRKLVKTTIKADRLACLAYIDENLKTA